MAGLVKRSFALSGHRTSVALEPEFWAALTEVAATRGQTLSALVAALDAVRAPDQPLASALRVFALQAKRVGENLRDSDTRSPAGYSGFVAE